MLRSLVVKLIIGNIFIWKTVFLWNNCLLITLLTNFLVPFKWTPIERSLRSLLRSLAVKLLTDNMFTERLGFNHLFEICLNSSKKFCFLLNLIFFNYFFWLDSGRTTKPQFGQSLLHVEIFKHFFSPSLPFGVAKPSYVKSASTIIFTK